LLPVAITVLAQLRLGLLGFGGVLMVMAELVAVAGAVVAATGTPAIAFIAR